VSQTLASYLGLPLTGLDGALQRDIDTSVLALTDGTSTTILSAEIAGKKRQYRAGRDAGMDVTDFTGQGGWADPTSGGTTLRGSSSDGLVSPGDCTVNCSNEYGLYGFHSSGCNALFADGSVRFLPNSINARITCALITRAGGETNTSY
jgi:prepilin-type processing-associated H-X9-DG protein